MRSRCVNMRSGDRRCRVTTATCGVAGNDAQSLQQHDEWRKVMRSRYVNMRSGEKRCAVATATCGVTEIYAQSLRQHAEWR